MDPVLAKEIQNLIDDNIGDHHRLEFILESIKNNKKIYNSDQKYLAFLLSQHSKDEDILERLNSLNEKPEEPVVTFADHTEPFKLEPKKSCITNTKPVNVFLQMIFAVIPILDIYASYKIQKLRLWVLIFWVVGGIIGWFYNETILSGGFLAQFLNDGSDFVSVIDYSGFVIIYAIIQAMVMRRWSKKWNESIQ